MLQGLGIGSFRGLVTVSHSRQVTMAPDRIHALMGIAPRQVRAYMASIQSSQPNQSVWELYTQFAKCMLENDPEWYFLSSAPSNDRPRELPTWVPNFNSRQPFASTFTEAFCGFSAGISPETRHLIKRTITIQELIAQGFRLDTVSEIIPQTAFREDNHNTRHHNVYGDAAREWELECTRLCQKVYNLDPEQFPRFHLNVLLAQSAAKPAMDGRALDGYRMFWEACRLRGETLRLINHEGIPIPERFRHLPDAIDRFADHAVKCWRNGLPVEKYALLLEFAGTMKSMCAGRPYISTSTGLLGLGCPGIQAGDVICIIYGTSVPYVLRPRPDGAMTFVGDAYIYNAMNGEALISAEKRQDEIIRIR